jgi:hypothetical protein
MVCTDACKEGLVGFVSLNRFVVCSKYRKLKEHKRIYSTHYLELEAIVYSLKNWRHYDTTPPQPVGWKVTYTRSFPLYWPKSSQQPLFYFPFRKSTPTVKPREIPPSCFGELNFVIS